MQAGLSYPVVRDLVLVGGGHAHALVLRMWAMNPLPGVRITLINPGPAAPYTGMLPGLIAGHYRRDEIMIDLIRLARRAGARVILDRVIGLDREAQRILLQDRPPLAYDVASLDIGITTDLPELPGFAEHGLAAKPLGLYAEAWEQFLARALPQPHLVGIGAGVGGIELALAAHHRLTGLGAAPRITLLEQAATPLPGLGAATRRLLLQRLEQTGIALRTGVRAAALRPGAVDLQDGSHLPSDFTLAVAGARPHPWLRDSGLDLTDGFVTVSPQLQSSDPAIFAAGDCAHMAATPRPKAGVFAVRQAPILNHNLRAALTGTPLRAFKPQGDYLKLIATGPKSALADKWRLPLQGPLLWRWKDRIDRRFMAQFETLPPAAPPLPAPAIDGLAEAMGDKPLCGGCGAKLGTEDLSRALAALPPPRRPEVLSGPGDDAAILQTATGVQVLTTDHLRAFTADARLMARIAATHALGDIWAMGAAPQVALAQITLPRLSAAKGAEMLAEIMTEATAVFRAEGADVVGGHTSVGAELTIGFTVTGLAPRAIAKAGARPGDALILTKALGSGTIMAAEMAQTRLPGLILGEAVAGALHQMVQPMGAAAALLAPLAHAMTDVTGFGLAGHLLEMLQASACAAELTGTAIPLLPGAHALAEAGQASSLAPANRAASLGRIACSDQGLLALLHDPQTCGGLLAALPETALPQLAAAGLPLHRIGTVTAGQPHIRVS